MNHRGTEDTEKNPLWGTPHQGPLCALGVSVVFLLFGCSKAPADVPALPFQTLGAFDYAERMKLPKDVLTWNGQWVKATGFINPTSQARDLKEFLLVKDRSSCCFGKQPQLNHYIKVKLKSGTANYSTDLITVLGRITVEERMDGDWPLGLYWMENAEVVK